MNDRIDDLIALAALGELSDPEAAELDAFVRSDPAVAAELDEALAGAAMLQAMPAEAPPASLRASVLDAIAGMAQDEVPPASDSGQTADDGASWVKHDEPTRHRRWFVPVLAAAAVLLLVVGGAIVVTNRDDGGGDPIAAVMDADDAVSMPMASEIGDLELWYSADEGAVVLTGDSLTVPPGDSTYQLWLVHDEVTTPLGTFAPDADGAMAPMRVDDVDPAGSILGITVEPAGGSEQPTLPMLASSA